MIEVKPAAETGEITCGRCSQCFAVAREPHLRCMGTERSINEGGFKPAHVKFCPFCGEEELVLEEAD